MFAGFYFWWPKMTGRMLDERLGKIHFWTLFFGFHTTFLVQHWLGAEGMARRYVDYRASEGFTTLNMISSVGAFLLGMSTLPFILNVILTHRKPKPVLPDDPWGYGRSLEWATSCPPPRHNFSSMPRIRSESPAFDLHHPEFASAHDAPTRGKSVLDQIYGEPDLEGHESGPGKAQTAVLDREDGSDDKPGSGGVGYGQE
jgi:cytochrome c oxidase subunit 1